MLYRVNKFAGAPHVSCHCSSAFSVTIRNKRKVTLNLHQAQIEVREYLLLFGAESFVFQFDIKKFKD